MMKVNMKHVVEIAGGLVLGTVAAEVCNGVAKLTKKGVEKLKNKKDEKGQ